MFKIKTPSITNLIAFMLLGLGLLYTFVNLQSPGIDTTNTLHQNTTSLEKNRNIKEVDEQLNQQMSPRREMLNHLLADAPTRNSLMTKAKAVICDSTVVYGMKTYAARLFFHKKDWCKPTLYH